MNPPNFFFIHPSPPSHLLPWSRGERGGKEEGKKMGRRWSDNGTDYKRVVFLLNLLLFDKKLGVWRGGGRGMEGGWSGGFSTGVEKKIWLFNIIYVFLHSFSI